MELAWAKILGAYAEINSKQQTYCNCKSSNMEHMDTLIGKTMVVSNHTYDNNND